MCIDCIFFFKQKTAYEVRISDWSSDVCSSDLPNGAPHGAPRPGLRPAGGLPRRLRREQHPNLRRGGDGGLGAGRQSVQAPRRPDPQSGRGRSEEHTSELQSLMRISYAVFCLKKQNTSTTYTSENNHSISYRPST